MKNSDWIIDLGPGAGDKGGLVVAEGTPEAVARIKKSSTGQYLKKVLAGEQAIVVEK
jgi:excinuclease ABC subunit A